MNDIGQAAVKQLRRQLQVDAEWSLDETRGFKWWGGNHAQRIWAEPCRQDDEFELSRIHVETDLVHGGDLCADVGGTLTRELRGMSLSGPIHDTKSPTTWRLACSAYANEDNLEWLVPLLGIAAAFQAREAADLAPAFARAAGGAPSPSGHPRTGLRTKRADMLNLPDYAKSLNEPPRFAGGGLAAAAGLLRGNPRVLKVTPTPSMLSIEAAYGASKATLVLNAAARNPNLGNGLLCLLSLPPRMHPNTVAEALRLNQREREEAPDGWAFGSWCTGQIGLTHVAFIPDIAYRPGIHVQIMMNSLMRLFWLDADTEDAPEPEFSPSLADRLRRILGM